ncbi:TIGR01244 family sulfur transferase [Pseudoxanthobacter sp.]|uniref:TIGR01244 family sulfur transferase n=1 Tax=Pseudoxanthobacter sp. TaxID=1925742 RepID=UPI002FDFF6C5
MHNVGTFDRLLRAAVGLALLALLVWGTGHWRWVGLFGTIPLFTALTGFCPLYQIFGLSTAGASGRLRTRRVDDQVSVSVALRPSDLPAVKAAGFVAIISSLPDDEAAVKAADMQARARDLGLAYTHIPVSGSAITRDMVRRFSKKLGSTRGPVLIHCRSGARSMTLWAVSQLVDGRMSEDEVKAAAARCGYNVGGAVAIARGLGARKGAA